MDSATILLSNLKKESIMEYFGHTDMEESSVSAVQIVGLILLFVGIAMCAWVFVDAVKLFKNPEEAELFEKILPSGLKTGELTIEGEEVILPKEFYYFLAYVVTIFTLAIAGFIGSAFLSGGVSLLNPSGEKLERKFNKRLRETEAKIDETLRRGRP